MFGGSWRLVLVTAIAIHTYEHLLWCNSVALPSRVVYFCTLWLWTGKQNGAEVRQSLFYTWVSTGLVSFSQKLSSYCGVKILWIRDLMGCRRALPSEHYHREAYLPAWLFITNAGMSPSKSRKGILARPTQSSTWRTIYSMEVSLQRCKLSGWFVKRWDLWWPAMSLQVTQLWGFYLSLFMGHTSFCFHGTAGVTSIIQIIASIYYSWTKSTVSLLS